MYGNDEFTVNVGPYTVFDPSCTLTSPVEVPVATPPRIWVSLQLRTASGVPPIDTELGPCVVPKLEPTTVTRVPMAPDVGLKPVITSGTVKPTLLLISPAAEVTTTFPVIAPVGTDVTILVSLQLLIDAETPAKVTVPCAAPKFKPVIVTGVVAGPDVTDKLVTAGCCSTVKSTPLL